MIAQATNDRSDDIFSRHLLEIGNRKVQVDVTSGQIPLPHNLCNLWRQTTNCLTKYFPIFK